MRGALSTTVFAGAVCCFSVVGCVPRFTRSEPSSVVVPAPSRPYLILTADRSTVRHGESVEFTALFVNPTGHKVALPTEAPIEGGLNSIEHILEVAWRAEDRRSGSSGTISAVGIAVCPPAISYLQPKTSRSYRLKWKFEERGKGTANLTYRFGSSDDFPPAKITLHTR